MHQNIQNGLATLAKNLGVLRNHVHERHHATMDSNVAFMEWLTRYLTRLENKMAQVKEALDKRTAERDAWKAYAQGQQGAVDAANAAATAAQAAVADAQAKEKTAEDALAAIPLPTDADDKAAVDAVIAAPDDLPPTAPPAA